MTTQVRSRDYKEFVRSEELDEVDLVISAGGDGTFIDAASKIPHDRLPVIGINTDPTV